MALHGLIHDKPVVVRGGINMSENKHTHKEKMVVTFQRAPHYGGQTLTLCDNCAREQETYALGPVSIGRRLGICDICAPWPDGVSIVGCGPSCQANNP